MIPTSYGEPNKPAIDRSSKLEGDIDYYVDLQMEIYTLFLFAPSLQRALLETHVESNISLPEIPFFLTSEDRRQEQKKRVETNLNLIKAMGSFATQSIVLFYVLGSESLTQVEGINLLKIFGGGILSTTVIYRL